MDEVVAGIATQHVQACNTIGNSEYLAKESFCCLCYPWAVSNYNSSSHHTMTQVAALEESQDDYIDLWKPKIYTRIEKSKKVE